MPNSPAGKKSPAGKTSPESELGNTIENKQIPVPSDDNAVIHLLNGDALQSRFPAEITGQQLVMRECLIDGPATKASGSALYTQRSNYLQKYDSGGDFPDYHEFVVPTFETTNGLKMAEKPCIVGLNTTYFANVIFGFVCFCYLKARLALCI